MFRVVWKLLAVLSVLLVAGLAFWYVNIEPIRSHRIWSNRVRADLKSLIEKQPDDVSPAEWEFMVGWTLNLHANCGTVHQFMVNRDDRDPFLAEFKNRLQGPVSLDTIDWIWDEYARITKGGQSYSDKYRPTRNPDRKLVQPGHFGLRDR